MNNSKEYLMQCLARHILSTCANAMEMERWFDRWEQRHGKAARQEIRSYVVAEKEKREDEVGLERLKQFGTPLEEHKEKLKADFEGQKKLYGEVA